MSKLSKIAIVAALCGFGGIGQAFAGAGGMGDPSTHMRRMQEICDAQKRGEIPREPTACLPDYPATQDHR